MPSLFNIFVVILSLASVFLGYLLVLKNNQLKKYRLEEREIDLRDQKSAQTLQEAILRAQDLLGQAAKDSQKLAEHGKMEIEEYEKEVEKQLKVLQDQSKINLDKQLQSFSLHLQRLGEQSGKANQQYQLFLNHLQSASQNLQSQSQETIKSQINKLFENFEAQLSQFLTQTEQESVRSIDLELRAARQLVDTYKQQQLALIDENAIAVLERTLALVLAKKLSLKDHLDLVYESLEQAKIEKFISEG